jgi:NAD(P)-dependent dehydrogenase (short-subunit alcohol dehydrogenase family)
MNEVNRPLSGQRALVTGASRGIGAACAVRLAEAGADVALLARSAADLATVAGAVRGHGRRAVEVPCDVMDPDAIEAACATAEQELGPVDVLVNNAGGPIFQSPIMRVRPEGWHRVFELNLTSALRLCQRLGAPMAARGHGVIVNVSSIATRAPWPAIAPYGAAKSGMHHLTQTLAAELGDHGVRVNSVSPAWIATAINTAYSRDDELTATAMDLVPLNRWGHSDDVAHAVVFLASPSAGFITGVDLPIDGGFSIAMPRRAREILDRTADRMAPA